MAAISWTRQRPQTLPRLERRNEESTAGILCLSPFLSLIISSFHLSLSSSSKVVCCHFWNQIDLWRIVDTQCFSLFWNEVSQCLKNYYWHQCILLFRVKTERYFDCKTILMVWTQLDSCIFLLYYLLIYQLCFMFYILYNYYLTMLNDL